MGVDYSQLCMVGFRVSDEELLQTREDPVYEMQPRYNTKTGEKTHEEKVLVKEAEEVYSFFGYEECNINELCEILYKPLKDVGLDVKRDGGGYYDVTGLVIGISIGDYEDFGRIDMLEGSISLEKIQEIADKIKKVFPNQEISIEFLSYVG